MKRVATWIKICGTTNLRDAQLSIDAGANALGFVFADSLRRVEAAMAAEIVAGVAGEVETIGVFVNESPQRVAEIAEQVGLSGVQLHGEEGLEEIAQLRQRLGQRKLIKAARAGDLLDMSGLGVEGFVQNGVDAMLLDSGSPQQRGGTGSLFDWEKIAPLVETVRERVPLIIAGGLNPANVGQAIALFQPWGVDVVSGVESAPGMKDENRLREFVSAVRQAV